MTSVTVPGPNGTTITQTFSNAFNAQLAQSIADALAAAKAAGTLDVETTNGAGALPPVPAGKIGELVIEPGTTSVTIPVSSGYSFVVDLSSGDTIFGSAGLSILGGDSVAGVGSTHTLVDPAVIALGDGNNVVTLTGAGDNIAVGNGNNTLTGTGSGTLTGGTGTDDFIVVGSYIVNSNGTKDTITAGDGAVTVNAAGLGALATTGDGKFTGHISGTADTVLGSNGFGATFVTLSGSSDVMVGGQAVMSVLDSGSSDTITAGAGPASVTAAGGGSFVNGGSGDLTFVGGASGSTIIGSSGDTTVFGAKGNTTLLGGDGGASTYIDTTTGGLFFSSQGGDETVDASLSKTGNTLFGGSGHDLMMGGTGADALTAGSGSDTLTGNGGADGFYFWSNVGGPSAHHFITDFATNDTVILGNYGAGAGDAAIAGAVTTGGATTITLSDGTQVTFVGLTSAAALNGHILST
jgi:Ca2+-binding RTX toxin-like protein